MDEQAEKLIELFTEIIGQHYNDEKEACRNTPLCTLNTNDLKVLLALEDKQHPAIKDISDELSLPMSTLTGIFNKLVGKGLVERDRCLNDRRVVRVHLTGSGCEVARLKRKHTHDFALSILSPLTEEEQHCLLSLLEKIVAS